MKRRSRLGPAQYKRLQAIARQTSVHIILDEKLLPAALREIDELRALVAPLPQRFRHGQYVREKRWSTRGPTQRYDPTHPSVTQEIGRISSRPRQGTKVVFVNWPSGWAGHVNIADLKPARAPQP